MLSLAPEVERLRETGIVDDATASRLIAIERREIVSVYNELRFLTWAGVMLVATGVGVLVARHLEEIGPIVIAIAIGIAAAACYAYAEWKRRRIGVAGAPLQSSLVDDFILLLAALLLSADVGYIEHQWHLFGSGWPRHLLVLAIVHAFVAYRFDSRLVLSLSISSLAAYLGIERRAESPFDGSTQTAIRAFACAAIVFVWRQVNRLRSSRRFEPVFEHFAANLAFWGALVLMFENETRPLGCFIALALAAASAIHGFRAREEIFVIYAWIYGTIAVDVFVADVLDDSTAIAFFLVISSIAAIAALFVTHARFRRAAT